MSEGESPASPPLSPAASPPASLSVSAGDWLREAARRLSAVRLDVEPEMAGPGALRYDGGVGLDAPRLSAELLLRHVTGLSRVDLLTHPERPLTEAERRRLDGLLRRREQGEPAAYLLGEREFFGRPFFVNPSTLIPRPDSETLVERALALPLKGTLRFADLGTGSGCLAVSLAAERPGWQGLALDLSRRALELAGRNARRHGVRLLLVRGDFCRPCLAPSSLDLVVSNPPYVRWADYLRLSPEVRDFEPWQALVPRVPAEHGHHHESPSASAPGDAGSPAIDSDNGPDDGPDDGLDALRAVAEAAFFALRPGGWLLMEHGADQAEALALWLSRHRWGNLSVFSDLSGKPRVAAARRPLD